MKSIILFVILASSLLTSTLVVAECTTNRNVDVSITKPDSIYIDNNDVDFTVTDKETGLMWQKCSLGSYTGSDCAGVAQTYTWQAALAAANSYENGGYTDWRLPNKNELDSLVEDACYDRAINETVFPATQGIYWSSSYVGVGSSAWYVDFYGGHVQPLSKNLDRYVRLVRGGN